LRTDSYNSPTTVHFWRYVGHVAAAKNMSQVAKIDSTVAIHGEALIMGEGVDGMAQAARAVDTRSVVKRVNNSFVFVSNTWVADINEPVGRSGQDGGGKVELPDVVLEGWKRTMPRRVIRSLHTCVMSSLWMLYVLDWVGDRRSLGRQHQRQHTYIHTHTHIHIIIGSTYHNDISAS